MGFFDFFKSSSSSSNSATKKYVGEDIHLTIPTRTGSYTVKAKSVNGPNGSKGVMYDCFMVALSQWAQQGMDESEFITDMKKVVELIAEGKSDNEVMFSLLSAHKAKNGRIIDSDMCTYISEILMAKIAVKGSCNKNVLLDQMMQVAERSFGDSLYITQYRRSGFGLQPYLIPFSEFVRNKR